MHLESQQNKGVAVTGHLCYRTKTDTMGATMKLSHAKLLNKVGAKS